MIINLRFWRRSNTKIFCSLCFVLFVIYHAMQCPSVWRFENPIPGKVNTFIWIYLYKGFWITKFNSCLRARVSGIILLYVVKYSQSPRSVQKQLHVFLLSLVSGWGGDGGGGGGNYYMTCCVTRMRPKCCDPIRKTTSTHFRNFFIRTSNFWAEAVGFEFWISYKNPSAPGAYSLETQPAPYLIIQCAQNDCVILVKGTLKCW